MLAASDNAPEVPPPIVTVVALIFPPAETVAPSATLTAANPLVVVRLASEPKVEVEANV